MNIEEVKKLYEAAQKQSENFRHGTINSISDLSIEIFFGNGLLLGDNFRNQAALNKILAKHKGFKEVNKFHEVYWNKLKSLFNKSFADGKALKEDLTTYLDDQLYPEYFLYVRAYKQNIFEYIDSNYPESVTDKYKDSLFSNLSYLYLGQLDKLLKSIEGNQFTVGNNKEEKKANEALSTILKNYLFKIIDAQRKIRVLLAIFVHSIYGSASHKLPIRKVPRWKELKKSEKERITTQTGSRPGRPKKIKPKDVESLREKADKALKNSYVTDKTSFWKELAELYSKDISAATLRKNYPHLVLDKLDKLDK